MEVKLNRPDGTPIHDWRAWSPPKKAYQWKPGRSAMELARAWFTSHEPACPREFRELLASSDRLSGLLILSGVPEFVTDLPERGEGRNHDLLLEGEALGRKVLITVEAKADEEFGREFVGEYWRDKMAGADSEPPQRSNAPARIEKLLAILAGPAATPNVAPWSELRYQLLTAAVGTLIEAQRREADLAVLVIHEFRTTETVAAKLERNAADLTAFLRALDLLQSGVVQAGHLYGPYESPGDYPPLLIGKALTDWGAA